MSQDKDGYDGFIDPNAPIMDELNNPIAQLRRISDAPSGKSDFIFASQRNIEVKKEIAITLLNMLYRMKPTERWSVSLKMFQSPSFFAEIQGLIHENV